MSSNSGIDYPTESGAPDPRAVFVIHGRNLRARDELGKFLEACGLRPLNFEDVRAKLHGTVTVSEVVEAGMGGAQGVIALLTPDETSALLPALRHAGEQKSDVVRWQARPNVMFEAGMAFARDRRRVTFVVLGDAKAFSDISGVYILRLRSDDKTRVTLRDTLREGMKCEVADSEDWRGVGDFDSCVVDQEKVLPRDPFTSTSKQGHWRTRLAWLLALASGAFATAQHWRAAQLERRLVDDQRSPKHNPVLEVSADTHLEAVEGSDTKQCRYAKVSEPAWYIPRARLLVDNTGFGPFVVHPEGKMISLRHHGVELSLGFRVTDASSIVGTSTGYFVVRDSQRVHQYDIEHRDGYPIRLPPECCRSTAAHSSKALLRVARLGSREMVGVWMAGHQLTVLVANGPKAEVVRTFDEPSISWPMSGEMLVLKRDAAWVLATASTQTLQLAHLGFNLADGETDASLSWTKSDQVPELVCATALGFTIQDSPIIGTGGSQCELALTELPNGERAGWHTELERDDFANRITHISQGQDGHLLVALTGTAGSSLRSVDPARNVRALDQYPNAEVVRIQGPLVVTKRADEYRTFAYACD